MAWLKRLKASLDKHSNEETSKEILSGCEKINFKSQGNEKALWVTQAVDKIDDLTDDDTRKKILLGCCDIFPKTRIKPLREKYLETGNIDDVIKTMYQDTSWGGLSYYEYPKRKGNVLYVIKNPFNPKKYNETEDKEEKKLYYCHCGLAKAALKNPDIKLSPTFCYCGAGWYKTLWEGILEMPIKIKVLQSIVQGDDCCEFAIYLPPDIK
ncbi:MAG: hypothetical protein FK734_03825 [Asgard group archaeon]|nr:hypothetical protein [Asgard group archaeon]